MIYDFYLQRKVINKTYKESLIDNTLKQDKPNMLHKELYPVDSLVKNNSF